MTNVENVNLTNSGTVARTFDATGITGVEKYSVDATTGATSITDMNAIAIVALSNQKSGSFSTAMDSTFVALNGTTDAMALEINNVGTAAVAASTGVAAVAEAAVAITLDDMETINIEATGTNVISIAGTDAKSLTVGGAGNVKVTAVSTATTSFDASASTGNITVDTTAAGANALTTLATGSGNDTITLDAADILANGAISAGAGEDTLALKSGATKTVQYNMSGVETLALTEITTGVLTFSGTNTSGLTTVSTVAANTAGSKLVNMGAIDLTVNAKGATVGGGTLESNHTGATTLNYVADAASVTAKTAQTSAADMTFSGSTDVTVNVGEYIATTGSAITAASATNLTVNVASGKSSAATPLELTKLDSAISAAKALSVTYNINGEVTATGAQTFAAATEATINNTGTAGAMNLQAAALENLTITSAKAFDMSSSVLSAVQVANITVNDGLFDMAAENLAKISSLTIGGTGVTGTGTTASSAHINNLGGDNAYDMNVVATGLKGGLDINTLNVGAGQNITVTASEVTGAVTLGNIGTGTTGKNVTVTTDGTGGAVDLSNVTATGLVTLVNSGASTYNVDVISAGSLNATTSNTVGAVTLGTTGTITTTGALTITNASVGAFTSTALSAGVTGDVTANLAGTIGAVTLKTIAGKTVNLDLSNTTGGVADLDTITALNSATIKLSEFQNNNAASLGGQDVTIDAATGSTALAVAVTGGTGSDEILINDVATTTSITVTGNLDGTVATDEVTVDADASTAATLAISLAGITNYNTGVINVANANAVTVTGGTGADTITFETAQSVTIADTINGGTGANTLVLTDSGLLDADLTNVTNIQTLTLGGASSVVLAAQAQEAGITAVTTDAAGTYVIDASAMTTAVTFTNTTTTTVSTITSGSADDTIVLAAAGGADIVQFKNKSKDTVTSFVTTEDHLSFDGITLTGGGAIAATTGAALTAGGTAALTDDVIHVIADGATSILTAGSETITDYTSLTDVAAYLAERFTSTANDDAAIFVINDLVGDKTYVYAFDEQTAGASTIDSTDLTLIGVITEAAAGALVAGDIS